jgi:hypothetical protein
MIRGFTDFIAAEDAVPTLRSTVHPQSIQESLIHLALAKRLFPLLMPGLSTSGKTGERAAASSKDATSCVFGIESLSSAARL